ncbi:MAG TPA: MFS transporter [Stellaceae bacterium]|nr:MFS transporter [Stellaceae bacterium]
MTDIAASNTSGDARHIVARLERLPYSSWHTNMRLIICTAWFFDAFDSIAIAYVLPPLIGLWHLHPQQIGSLIGIGFAGQLFGALSFGWIAERWGRRNSMLVTLLIYALGSLACAFSASYTMLWWLRFIQGIGLGGEVPLMAAYVNEFAHAKGRGRFSLNVQVLFAIGLTAVALVGVYVVPHLGWRWMFIIGALPALVALPLRQLLPESPRWLASQGRFSEADQALKRIEDIALREGKSIPPLPANLPPVVEVHPRIIDLFKGIYLKRTISVWLIWIGAYFVSYGVTAWMPTLFRTVYHLPVQLSITYGFIISGVGLCGSFLAIYLIEAIGRRKLLILSLTGSCIPLLAFAFLPHLDSGWIIRIVALGFFFLTMSLLSLATYTAEIYPTHLRALGGGVASAWQRGASTVGTIMVGVILPLWGINAVFVMFGLFAAMGAIVALVSAVETRGQVLEKVSPSLVQAD